MADIHINNIDIDLLREQRNGLITLTKNVNKDSKEEQILDGVINLLDEMLDIAEGYT